MDHSCCKTGAPHQHEGAGHDYDMNAGHDMHAMHGHDHSGHDMHAGHDHSHHDPGMFKKQFWFAFALTIPTMYFSHTVHMLLGYPLLSFAFSEYIPAVLGVVLFFTGGRVFLKTGWQEVKSKQPGMMALIALALIVAFGYSSFITVTQIFELGWVGMDFWWELAALVAIMLLGHWIEMASVMGAQNAVGALAKLVPDNADKVEGERVVPVAVSSLKVGDLVLVRPGAAIPVDGVVIDGSSKVDESMVTGESAAVAKEIGSEVIAGTINATSAALGQGALTIRVTKVGSQTMLANIIRLVQAAQASKSKTQLLADRAAGWLFYVALGSAIATAVVWSVLGTQTTDYVLERIVTVLVIACPHALGLAIPLVTSITTAKAARGGLIIRSRKDFESLRKVDVVVFDKTGTLTTGKRTVIESTAVGTSMRELVGLAAGLEKYSEHPLAKSIVEFAEKWEYEPLDVKDFRVVPGVGVSGIYESSNILVGGPAMLTQRGVVLEVQHLVDVNEQNEAGNTVVFILRDSTLLGWISIGDEVRESAASAVAELKRMGKKVVMLSGDAHGVVARVAGDLGIDDFFAEVLPQHKVEVIEKLQSEGKVVAMVGDGVNDAPALARAEVGIAIGAGTDVAIESAGLVLVSSDPAGIAGAVALSKRSYSKMVQNLIWGAGYNALAIPLAAGVFAPVGFVLSPALGAVLMSLSTIIVAANAQLLRR
jgi:Cu2+-exporting ATPase